MVQNNGAMGLKFVDHVLALPVGRVLVEKAVLASPFCNHAIFAR
jgi:hypothetical protein